MFKVSQEISLTSNCESQNENNIGVYGTYKSAVQNGNNNDGRKIFISPDSTDISHVQILQFPIEPIRQNSYINFVIKHNGARGNFEVNLESPNGQNQLIPVENSELNQLRVKTLLTQLGLHKFTVKLNGVSVPGSPFFVAVEDIPQSRLERQISNFQSDATKVTVKGHGLTTIARNRVNEFIVDASKAGTNILLVGICGPNGQCDHVTIRHVGNNIFSVSYQVRDVGNYLIAAKWGDDHIQGSPFKLIAN